MTAAIDWVHSAAIARGNMSSLIDWAARLARSRRKWIAFKQSSGLWALAMGEMAVSYNASQDHKLSAYLGPFVVRRALRYCGFREPGFWDLQEGTNG
jgi:hypothetical protein